jgi:hypothetical protein
MMGAIARYVIDLKADIVDLPASAIKRRASTRQDTPIGFTSAARDALPFGQLPDTH